MRDPFGWQAWLVGGRESGWCVIPMPGGVVLSGLEWVSRMRR